MFRSILLRVIKPIELSVDIQKLKFCTQVPPTFNRNRRGNEKCFELFWIKSTVQLSWICVNRREVRFWHYNWVCKAQNVCISHKNLHAILRSYPAYKLRLCHIIKLKKSIFFLLSSHSVCRSQWCWNCGIANRRSICTEIRHQIANDPYQRHSNEIVSFISFSAFWWGAFFYLVVVFIVGSLLSFAQYKSYRSFADRGKFHNWSASLCFGQIAFESIA